MRLKGSGDRSSSGDEPLPAARRTGNVTGAQRGLTDQALGGMLWTFSGTGVQGVVQLLALMALGRLLTPAEFGLMGAATVVIAFSQIVSHVGVGPAIVQRRDLNDTHIRTAFTISGGLGLVLGVVVWSAAPSIAAFYRMPAVEPILRVVALLFPIDGLNTVGKSLLMRALRFRLYVAIDVGSYILGYACIGVLLAWYGYGVWALVAANMLQVALRTVAMYVVTRHSLRPSLNWPASRDLLSFGVGHSLAQFALVLSQQGDNLIVGRWLGPAALGIYGRAYNLMVLPATAFGKIVNRVLFPIMSRVQDERDRLAGGYERALAIVALISLPVSATLWIVAPEFIPVLLGPNWTGVVLPFRLFTCGLFFRMSSKVTDACVKAAGAVYPRALIQGMYAVLVVVSALVGQRWGIGGVAVAVSIAMGINWLMMATLGRSVTGLSWRRFVSAQVPSVLLAALTAASVLYAAYRAGSAQLLGPHGAWAFGRAAEMAHRRRGGYGQVTEPGASASRRGSQV